MRKINLKISKITAMQVLLLLCAIAIVSLCLPKEHKFHYSYQIDKPWEYSLLTAPFDIPIELDTASASALRDSIVRNFVNVYSFDRTVSSKHLQAVAAIRSGSSSERLFFVGQLREIYRHGIVDSETFSRIRNGHLPYVRQVGEDHTIVNTPTGDFFSVRSAYEYIDSLAARNNYHQSVYLKTINRYLEPNILIDSVRSNEILHQQLQKELAPIGMIQKGERIIDRGNVVTPQVKSAIDYLKKEYTDNNLNSYESKYITLSKVVIIAILFIMLYIYLAVFRHNIFYDLRKLLFVMSLLTCFTAIFFIGVSLDNVKASYIMPFALVPIVMATFFDSGTAVVVHVVEVMIASIVSTYSTDLVLMQMVVGIIAIASLQEMSRRSQLARCAALVMISYSICYLAFFMMEKGTLNGISKYVFVYFLINAIFLSFSNLLIYVLEKMFGFTSSLTLIELTDLNQPLLRQLSESCPGTFQHVMQVSNIAAEAAHRIGANVQLVRVGAIYHDIGKIKSPNFFTENQRGINPHTLLTPEQSASIVIRHVTDGMELAEKSKLPQAIKDFILQHHGRGLARYFYAQACMNADGKPVDEEPFTYPGPNPQTRETAIVMMADATEAASKSLTNHTHEAIASLVSKIIDGQVASGLLKDAPISFRDVEIIKNTFIERLDSLYHTRIKYPDQITPKKPESDTPTEQPEAPAASAEPASAASQSR